MKTLIITPAYNEEKFIKATIDSVVSQKLLPVEWVIVDDQSEDNTSDLIKEAASKHNWITYLKKEKKRLFWTWETCYGCFLFWL